MGHCHPAVVEAIARQESELNTHTRYLHEGILENRRQTVSAGRTNLIGGRVRIDAEILAANFAAEGEALEATKREFRVDAAPSKG